MADLKTETIARVLIAKTPEAVFAGLPYGITARLAEIRRQYTTLAMMLHPDRNPGAPEAEQAMAVLNGLYERAREKIRRGTWGKRSGATIKAGRTYVNVIPLAAGDICDVYAGEYDDDKEAVIKVARSPRDSDLLANEASVLAALHSRVSKEDRRYRKYLPVPLEQARLKIGSVERAANVFEYAPDGYTLTDVIAKQGGRLDPRHVAWIWKRMLEGIDWVHRCGYVHAGLNTDHVLVFPKTHGIHILDWSYAVKPGGRLKAISAPHRFYYPPEVRRKQPVTAGVDIHMIAECVIAMLGGDPDTQTIPPEAPSRYVGLVRASLLAPGRRYEDAFEVYRELDKHLVALFGPPKFIPLEL